MDGKYNPIEVSSTKKHNNDTIFILSVAQGAAVAAVNDIHPANTTAAICRVDPVENSKME